MGIFNIIAAVFVFAISGFAFVKYFMDKKPVEPMGSVKPRKPVEPMGPAKPAKPMKPVKSVKPAKPRKPVEPMKPAKPMKAKNKIVNALAEKEGLIGKYEKYIFGAIFIIAVIVRVARFISLPGGLNQDEASMGYDAYATAFFGIDRNGFHFPAYAVSWGDGQNTLLMYITALFVRLFGLSVFTVRLAPLLLGIASPVVMYLLVKKIAPGGRPAAALCAMLLLAVSPWHVMVSRWALESNVLPGVFLIAVYLLVCAADMKRPALPSAEDRPQTAGKDKGLRQTLCYCASALVLALSMYAYATVCIVMPLFIVAVMVFLMRGKYINIKQTALSAAVFLVVSAPLALFFIVNLLKLESIATPFFSAPLLVAMPAKFAFGSIGENIKTLFTFLIKQYDGLLWNSIENIGTVYIFMTPFTIAGVFSVIADRKRAPHKMLMLAWFLCAFIMACVIYVNINRINFIYIPLIYLISEGAVFVCERVRPGKYVVAVSLLVGVVAFCGVYFGEGYSREVEQVFCKGFGEAVSYAGSLDIPVYVENVNGAYALTLFYDRTDPHEFVDTVVYTDPDTEFRQVKSFGKYRFYMPTTFDYGAAYIVSNIYVAMFDKTKFEVNQFEYYSVVVGRRGN